MNHADTPVYQSVIEKSRGLLFRSQAMASAMEVRAAGGVVDRDSQRVGGRAAGGQKRTGGQGGPRGGQQKKSDGAQQEGEAPTSTEA